MEEIWDESMREGLGGLILRVAIAEGWEEKYLGIRGTEKGQGWAESESDEGRGTKEGVHCKKELAIFPSPAGMSLTKLSLGGKKLNYSRPGRVWSVTSRLGTGKRLTLFYSVHIYMNIVNCNILTTKCAVNMYLACHENYILKSLIHSDDSFSIVLFAFDELLFCIVSLFVFYCTVLYCIVLYCILFYCIRTRFHEKEKREVQIICDTSRSENFLKHV